MPISLSDAPPFKDRTVRVAEKIDCEIRNAQNAVAAFKSEATHDSAHDVCFYVRAAAWEFFRGFNRQGELCTDNANELISSIEFADKLLTAAIGSELANDALVPEWLESVRWHRRLVQATIERDDEALDELVAAEPRRAAPA